MYINITCFNLPCDFCVISKFPIQTPEGDKKSLVFFYATLYFEIKLLDLKIKTLEINKMCNLEILYISPS